MMERESYIRIYIMFYARGQNQFSWYAKCWNIGKKFEYTIILISIAVCG